MVRRAGLVLLLALATAAGASRLTTFAWDQAPEWPAGTTVELCANDYCETGITATQHTLDVPVEPGGVIRAQARAHAGGESSNWAELALTWPANPIGVWSWKAETGGSPVTISFVSAVVNSTITTGSSASVTKTVTAGNLVVAIALWEGAATTVSISDGTTTFTNGTAGKDTATNDINACPAWLLSANGGSKTFTLTLGASRLMVALHILEFSTDTSGATWALDGQAAYEQGNSTALSSGDLTTAGTEVVGIGFGRNWTSSSYSSQTIGGNTAAEAVDNGGYSGTSFYYIGTFSGDADATASASQHWLQGLIAFKASAGSAAASLVILSRRFAHMLVR